MIPREIIEEIRSKADIVKIISEYVRLRKRGKNYLGLCPFHQEKDPSFTVSSEKQLWHCFGCNEGGNIFAFLMGIENIGFVEAVEELGTKLGIAVPKAARQGASKSEHDKLYQITLLAAKYFRACLEDKTGAAAQNYLKKRGILSQTINQFGLGFAPAGWDNLFKHLVARGADPNLIEKTGLILARQGTSGYYDRFRNRLIFPIIDPRHRVIAFGGRSLADEEPKYLNSPDTAIYHKGEILFGLNLSKEDIKKSKTAVLVEGNFDLITPFQAGITNIAATLGTALTAQQCKLLARYSETIILAFDADSAGSAAAERSISLLRNQGLKVKVAELKGGKDPDDIIQNKGAEVFKKCLTAALPFLEFRIRRILSRHNLTEIESKAKALKQAASLLSQESEAFVQKEYAKLVASLLKTDPETVLLEIKRVRHYQRSGKDFTRKNTEKPSSKISEAEKNLIVLASQDHEALKTIKQEMKIDDFNLPETKTIAELLFAAELKENDNPAHFLLENLADEEAKKFLSRLLLSEHLSLAGKKEEILSDCLKVIKGRHLENRIKSLKAELKAAEKAGESKKAADLLSALKSEIS